MQDRRQRELALAERLAPVSRAWKQIADEALSSLGVSESSGWALVHVLRMGQEVRLNELARRIGVSEPSLVRTINLLEGAGLIIRSTDAGDRRAKRIILSQEGERTAKRIETRLLALRADLLKDIADEDLEVAVSVLDMIADRIAWMGGKP